MNKAKFLLAGIGLFAVAASALASKISSVVYVRPATTTLCELTKLNATTVFTEDATTTIQTFATDVKGAPCPLPINVYQGPL